MQAANESGVKPNSSALPPKIWWEGPLKDRFLPGQSSDQLISDESVAKEACQVCCSVLQCILVGNLVRV